LVKNYIRRHGFQEKHTKLLAESEDYGLAIKLFRSKTDGLRKGRTRVKLANTFDAAEVMSFIYQIRCNLFHGGKLPADHWDKELVSAAYTALDLLIFTP